MSVIALGLALLLVAQAARRPTTARLPPRPGLTWEDADHVARTLRRIDRRLRSGRRASKQTVVVTERQLNSFVNLSLAEQIPPELSDLEFQLEADRLGARGRLDLDQLRAKMPEGGHGVAPLDALGRGAGGARGAGGERRGPLPARARGGRRSAGQPPPGAPGPDRRASPRRTRSSRTGWTSRPPSRCPGPPARSASSRGGRWSISTERPRTLATRRLSGRLGPRGFTGVVA